MTVGITLAARPSPPATVAPRRARARDRSRATRAAATARATAPLDPSLPSSSGSIAIARRVTALAAAATLAAAAPPALAVGPVSVPFEDVTYARVECARGTMSSVGGAVNVRAGVACVEFSATAKNPSSKALNNADVYGRVYDGNGSAVTDVSENNRIAYVDEVPAGTSKVTFALTMPATQYEAGALSWSGLKASGFAGKILPGQTGGLGLLGEDECELAVDPAECESDRAAMGAVR